MPMVLLRIVYKFSAKLMKGAFLPRFGVSFAFPTSGEGWGGVSHISLESPCVPLSENVIISIWSY